MKSSHYHYHTTLLSHEFADFNVLTDSVDKSSSAFFVFMLLFVCVLIISVRNLIAIFYVKIKQIMYRTDSLSQISQIANYLEKQKLQKQIIQGDINQGGKLKDLKRKWVFSQDYQIPDVCFPHQFPKKRKDNKFQLNRLRIFDSLVSCFTVLILAKKHKIVFGFMNFPKQTFHEKHRKQYLQYNVYSYSF